MRYRKFKADFLFTGEKLLDHESVLVTTTNGKIMDIVKSPDGGEEVETYKGIISPGFINAHCHLELSHLKKVIPEGTGLVDFVFKVVSERHFREKEIIEAMKTAEKEMIHNGIVATGDISNNPLSVTPKQQGNMQYYNFIETSGWLPEAADERIEKSKSILKDFVNHGLTASIVPHAPYSVSDRLWQKMVPFFSGKTVSIHNQESAAEDLLFLDGTGDFQRMYRMMAMDHSFYVPGKTRSVEHYFKKLSPASSVILVHNTFTKQVDIDFIKEHKKEDQLVSFCLCPNANLYIENRLPPVELFVRNQCHIVLGTDSLASNHRLNILEEIKTISKAFPAIETETFLKWATINGARALQKEDRLGSFEKGKVPGVILLENTEGGHISAGSEIKNLFA